MKLGIVTHTHTHTHTQSLLDGFSDHHAVENFISQQGGGKVQTDGEKIKVDVGTLRTKVLVQESKTTVQYNTQVTHLMEELLLFLIKSLDSVCFFL